MTEIIPFPQNRYFTVLRALPFAAEFFDVFLWESDPAEEIVI